MIKFFRNVRQKLIKEGKTANPAFTKASAGTYLKYAIGEIFLVVVGILIALQINNWNETRKYNNLKKVYINRLIDDLKQDTLQANVLVDDLNNRQRIIETVINDLDTAKDGNFSIPAIENYFKIGWNMLDFTPSASTYSDLSQTGNMNVFRNSELTDRIKNYYVFIEDAFKSQNINKDWIIPLDVTMSRETTAFEFDPITKHLFKTEHKNEALLNLRDNKELFKRNAAGHFWFNHSLKKGTLAIKTMAMELMIALNMELEKN
jgi:hypothetical protein